MVFTSPLTIEYPHEFLSRRVLPFDIKRPNIRILGGMLPCEQQGGELYDAKGCKTC